MPLLVKVLAVLYYAGAVLNIGIAVFLILLAVGLSKANPLIGAVGVVISLLLALVLIVWAIIEFFIARGLWKGRKWARITAILLSVVGFLIAAVYLKPGTVILGISMIIVHAAVIAYLLLNKEAKQAFE